ncbi:glycosyltransferase family 4 protein [Chryseobacterium gotjawalense]|uniref:Glycosyltransferase family 4 protein n=1 Tax=Chryseobacterium gotjawalense TaxID=3042315 RepID=A0ABY8RHF7_9FLAO|nr:glycosyltransferase family 4 protein [Chryseobacterium sp. wdc7]WHF53054.1 glycosyltransferase family 4 protein [Chryseobacterium sp. wdc7]
MKIAFILPSLANQAPVLVCKDIIDYLPNVVECKVFYFDSIEEVKFNCEIERIGFFDKIDFGKYDIIHSHMLRPDLFLAINSLTNLSIKKKLITTIHTDIFKDLAYAYGYLYSKIVPNLWLQAWKRLNKCVVLSQSIKDKYQVIDSKTVVIKNGKSISHDLVDEEDKLLLNQLKNNYKIIGTVCFYDDRKALHQVIQGLVHFKDLVFVVVGSGKDDVHRKLVKLAKDLNVLDRVFFLGSKIKGDRYMEYFDFYVMSSTSESAPLALIEAMGHGKPVICSDLNVFRDNFNDDDVCYFELENINSFKDALGKAINNYDLYTEKSKFLYSSKYSPKKMSESYYKLYESMYNENNN